MVAISIAVVIGLLAGFLATQLNPVQAAGTGLAHTHPKTVPPTGGCRLVPMKLAGVTRQAGRRNHLSIHRQRHLERRDRPGARIQPTHRHCRPVEGERVPAATPWQRRGDEGLDQRYGAFQDTGCLRADHVHRHGVQQPRRSSDEGLVLDRTTLMVGVLRRVVVSIPERVHGRQWLCKHPVVGADRAEVRHLGNARSDPVLESPGFLDNDR